MLALLCGVSDGRGKVCDRSLDCTLAAMDSGEGVVATTR